MERTARVPYKGSKNAIARDIIGVLPRGKRFVDLFAGGSRRIVQERLFVADRYADQYQTDFFNCEG